MGEGILKPGQILSGPLFNEPMRVETVRFNLKGRKKKERLRLSFNEALTRAERDIKQDWSTYRERFLKGEFP